MGRALADLLHLGFFDTGLMYRACTLAVLDASVDPNDEAAVTALVAALAAMYVQGVSTRKVKAITEEIPATPERDAILDFVKGSSRGLMRGYSSEEE